MEQELRFQFSVREQVVCLYNNKTGEQLVSLSREEALWLAERILKNFDFRLE